MKVGKIVDTHIFTIDENASIFEAAQMMNMNHVYGLFVVDQSGKYVGMLSERSMLKRFIQRNVKPDSLKVKSVMRHHIPKVPSDYDVKDVAAFLSKNALTRCAVYDDTGKILGLVTITDLARYLSSEKIYDVLFSHKTRDYTYICPKCSTGKLEAVYSHKGEITIFKCNNPDCDYVE
ncbi:MAG: CBS domain-containing protein [Cuniculiplasma sp.]